MNAKSRVVLITLSAVGLIAGLLTPYARSETLVDSTLATRIVLTFQAGAAELQARLPDPWKVAPMAGGPWKGANLFLIFQDALLNQDEKGNPAPDAIDRTLALVIPAKHGATGEFSYFVFGILTPNPQSLPGRYKNSVLASVSREYTMRSDGLTATVTERFDLREAAGGAIELRLQYQTGMPSRAKAQFDVRSTTDLSVLRKYRVEQLIDVVRSVPAGVDRVQSYQLRVTVPELRKVFDGTEQLVSIVAVPVFVRDVFGQ